MERSDDATMQQLLFQGNDPEERFEGWTPLMKAPKEGAVEVMRMLRDKKVDIEASNRKGRTLLSFAAAPSMDGTTPHNTPVEALHLLLQRGADAKRKDVRDQTAKDYALKSKREEAVAIFDKFAC